MPISLDLAIKAYSLLIYIILTLSSIIFLLLVLNPLSLGFYFVELADDEVDIGWEKEKSQNYVDYRNENYAVIISF